MDYREVEKLLVLVGAIRSGLVDVLAAGGPRAADDIAAEGGLDPRASGMVLRALAEVGVVDMAAGAGGAALYSLNQLGRSHLVEEGPEFERYSLLHQVNKFLGWAELPYVIQTGEPPRDRVRRDVRSFARTMAEGDPGRLDEVVDACLTYAGRSIQVRRAVDLGGGAGHFSRAFARRGIAVTLCDRDEILAEAKQFLGDEADLLDLQSCDFTREMPAGPFDLAFLGSVYHIYGPETNARLTRDVFSILNPGGVVAVRDFVYERSPHSVMFAVNMLQATTAGGVWTERQYRDWMTQAGFSDVEIVDLMSSSTQLILGRRPAA